MYLFHSQLYLCKQDEATKKKKKRKGQNDKITHVNQISVITAVEYIFRLDEYEQKHI